MNESQANPRKPRLMVIAGPNGSGKTTVIRRMVDLSWFPEARVVNWSLVRIPMNKGPSVNMLRFAAGPA